MVVNAQTKLVVYKIEGDTVTKLEEYEKDLIRLNIKELGVEIVLKRVGDTYLIINMKGNESREYLVVFGPKLDNLAKIPYRYCGCATRDLGYIIERVSAL